MKLSEIVKRLDLTVCTAKDNLDIEVSGGYSSDLLSDVIGNSKEGNVWITLQVHENIVAVASLKNLVGIILVNNRKPQAETVEKAEREKIPIAVSELPTFELVGKLYTMGISGT